MMGRIFFGKKNDRQSKKQALERRDEFPRDLALETVKGKKNKMTRGKTVMDIQAFQTFKFKSTSKMNIQTPRKNLHRTAYLSTIHESDEEQE